MPHCLQHAYYQPATMTLIQAGVRLLYGCGAVPECRRNVFGGSTCCIVCCLAGPWSERLVEVNPLDPVADTLEVLLEGWAGDDNCSAAIVGVETERFGVLQVLVQKENDVVVGVVDESERTDTARFQAQIAHHTLGRGKRQLARGRLSCRLQGGFETLLKVVDSQVVVAVEADEVVLIALVVAHEDVLAMHAAIVVPPAFCLLNGLALGVVVARVRNMVPVQPGKHQFLTRIFNRHIAIYDLRIYDLIIYVRFALRADVRFTL